MSQTMLDAFAALPTSSHGGPKNVWIGVGIAVFVAVVFILVFLRLRRKK